ncbi:MAG: DUF4097 family beta strand repeat-containing protein [Acidobacteriota bacterium]|nr:DUF4097 family beta strand repeat-containing protein [Acidobacteriota bacterium]
MSPKRRPSLLAALIWIGVGVLFLLQNFGFGIDFWSLAGRYWPLLLILLGLGKIIDYFLKKDAVSVSVGEIIGILLLLLIGSAVTKISETHIARIVRELPIQVGGFSVRPGQWIGESHTFTEENSFPLERDLPILIENAYGSVSVSPGSDGVVRTRLRKVVYANEARARAIAPEIRLEAGAGRRGAPSAAVKPEAEPGKASGVEYFVVQTNREALSSKEYTYNTDLEITVPKNSQIQIRNSFGDVRVAGINGKLDIDAAHRSLEIRDCTGEFALATRFTESRLLNLVGNVKLDSRSRGKVYIENIKGDLDVASEYSPVEVSNVDGKLQLSNTEGSIRVDRITKPVVIDSRGSRIEAQNLQDSLKLTASHKDIEIADVASTVIVDSRYASIALKRIKGNIEIRSNSDTISAYDIGGGLKLRGSGSGVRVHGITGPLDVQTTLKDVVVDDYAGPCTVTSEHAGISVSSRTMAKGDVVLRNQGGDVDLFLPQRASFQIEASAKNGKVESNYDGLDLGTDREPQVLKSKVNNGGPRISLETSYGTIRIHPVQDYEEERSENSADFATNSMGVEL